MAIGISQKITTLKYQKNGGASYVKVGKITALSRSVDGNKIGINNFDQGDFEEFLNGRRNVTLSVTCLYDMTDTAQGDLEDDHLLGLNGDFQFGPDPLTAGDVLFSGSGSPSNITTDFNDDEVATISFDIQISGTWTKTVGT